MGVQGYGLIHPGPYSERAAERKAERRKEALLSVIGASEDTFTHAVFNRNTLAISSPVMKEFVF